MLWYCYFSNTTASGFAPSSSSILIMPATIYRGYIYKCLLFYFANKRRPELIFKPPFIIIVTYFYLISV